MLSEGNGARDRNTGIEPDQRVSTCKPSSAAPYKSITSRATRKPFEATASVEKVAPSRSFVLSIVRCVADKHRVNVEDVLGASRTAKVWNARREALTLIHEAGEGRFSTTGIGRAFGCDHTTVLYNIKPEHYRSRRRAQVLARHNEARP